MWQPRQSPLTTPPSLTSRFKMIPMKHILILTSLDIQARHGDPEYFADLVSNCMVGLDIFRIISALSSIVLALFRGTQLATFCGINPSDWWRRPGSRPAFIFKTNH